MDVNTMMEAAKAEADALPEHHRIHRLPLDRTYCEENADALEAVLQDLNSLFSAVGVEITVDDHTLTIDVAEEKFASVTTRKAGRKKKMPTSDMRRSWPTGRLTLPKRPLNGWG